MRPGKYVRHTKGTKLNNLGFNSNEFRIFKIEEHVLRHCMKYAIGHKRVSNHLCQCAILIGNMWMPIFETAFVVSSDQLTKVWNHFP